jgi:hypothetical protein
MERRSAAVILSREDGEGSQGTRLEILRYAQDDGMCAGVPSTKGVI